MGSEFGARVVDGRRKFRRIGFGDVDVAEPAGELVELLLGEVAAPELLAGIECDLAEILGTHLLAGCAHDPERRQEAGLAEIEQAGKKLPLREVARRPEQDDHVR